MKVKKAKGQWTSFILRKETFDTVRQSIQAPRALMFSLTLTLQVGHVRVTPNPAAPSTRRTRHHVPLGRVAPDLAGAVATIPSVAIPVTRGVAVETPLVPRPYLPRVSRVDSPRVIRVVRCQVGIAVPHLRRGLASRRNLIRDRRPLARGRIHARFEFVIRAETVQSAVFTPRPSFPVRRASRAVPAGVLGLDAGGRGPFAGGQRRRGSTAFDVVGQRDISLR